MAISWQSQLIKAKQWSLHQTAYMWWWWYTPAESDNNMREPSSTWCGTCLSTTRPYSPDFGEAATTSTSPQHLRWLWCNWCHHSGHCHQVRKALLDVDVNLWKFYDQWVLKNNVWPLVWKISLQSSSPHQYDAIIPRWGTMQWSMIATTAEKSHLDQFCRGRLKGKVSPMLGLVLPREFTRRCSRKPAAPLLVGQEIIRIGSIVEYRNRFCQF